MRIKSKMLERFNNRMLEELRGLKLGEKIAFLNSRHAGYGFFISKELPREDRSVYRKYKSEASY